MADSPYTKKQLYQFRGPTNSNQYNEHSENVYQDLVYLYNKAHQIESEAKYSYSALTKDIRSLTNEIQRLQSEKPAEPGVVYFTNNDIVDNERFIGTTHEVTNPLVYDVKFGQYHVQATTSSRLKYFNSDNKASVPPHFESVVIPAPLSAESYSNARVKSTEPYLAILSEPGRVWEVNVASPALDRDAEANLIFNLPDSLTNSDYINRISLVGFPVFGVQITGVYYTEDIMPDLALGNTNWVEVNKDDLYQGLSDAVGHVAPGAWSGDEITRAGAHNFVFPRVKATAIRITLKQDSYYEDATDITDGRYIYTYGLSHLDVGYNRFEASGESIFLIEANDGETISSVDQVTPYLYNIPDVDILDYFSYDIIWETAPNSGSYTTSEVPLSNRVWLKVTLNTDEENHSPLLSGFKLEYS